MVGEPILKLWGEKRGQRRHPRTKNNARAAFAALVCLLRQSSITSRRSVFDRVRALQMGATDTSSDRWRAHNVNM
jgi:hypothetical protein